MPTKETYNKSALTIKEQIELLKKRGLIIDNEEETKHYLNNISYYNLSGYFKPYQDENDIFFKDTNFDKIMQLYFFDRKLRLLFINALERIEKSFKTQFIYNLSIDHGADYLINDAKFSNHKKRIDENLMRSKEPFITNFKEKYSNEYPPLWILAEVLSFGDILAIFSQSLDPQDKKKIAQYYCMNREHLYSWLDNLREIRNICAHHSRLWNRKITKHLKRSETNEKLQYNSYIFDSIIITEILLKRVSPGFDWIKSVKTLIEEYDIEVKKMGFPDNWKELFE